MSFTSRTKHEDAKSRTSAEVMLTRLRDRKRTHVELHSGDTELTEIFILDHSCVPFVCINAIKKHEEQIESFRMRMRGWK